MACSELLSPLRRRIGVPLELIATLAFIIASYAPYAFNSAACTLYVCGYSYLQFPSSIASFIVIGAVFALAAKLFSVLGRCKRRYEPGGSNRYAVLMPAAGIDNLEGRCALYTRKINHVLGLLIYVVVASIATWYIGKDMPHTYFALGPVLAVLVLNLLLGVANALRAYARIHIAINLLTVLATVCEHKNLRLSEEGWDAVQEKEVEKARSNIERQGVVLDENDSRLLYIPGSGDFGTKYSEGVLNFGLGSIGDPVRIERKGRNFRLTPLRPPFIFIWYTVYKTVEKFQGYNGGDEIDKCLLWLVVVTISSAIILASVPGPCVVVEDEQGIGESRIP